MLEHTAAGRLVHSGLTLMLCSGVDTVYIRVETGGENERNRDPTNHLKGTLTKTKFPTTMIVLLKFLPHYIVSRDSDQAFNT